MTEQEFTKLLAEDVVREVDPVESADFDELAAMYLEDPTPMVRPDGGKGGAGGAGIGEWMEIVTPGAMAAAAGALSYLFHHVLLPKLPRRGRDDSVATPLLPCGSTGYEQCLQQIRKDLPASLHEAFDIYELRLIETVCEARLYGETQETYAMRYRLINQINQLTRDAKLSRTFTDLCQGKRGFEPRHLREVEEIARESAESHHLSPESLQQLIDELLKHLNAASLDEEDDDEQPNENA